MRLLLGFVFLFCAVFIRHQIDEKDQHNYKTWQRHWLLFCLRLVGFGCPYGRLLLLVYVCEMPRFARDASRADIAGCVQIRTNMMPWSPFWFWINLHLYQAGITVLTRSTLRLKCTLPNINDTGGVSLAEEYALVGVCSTNAHCCISAGVDFQHLYKRQLLFLVRRE